ncbi:YncE family protein [Bacillus sp. FJAT-45350]|uniref:YncE family protein n=1 Tax=Bacillus sp. FJAT-45350 TaxID=2011014 RepID=UPI000BB87185|nr:quinohemoprotein amine dehydrogenase [Bacillus sp. FJAT-45350]
MSVRLDSRIIYPILVFILIASIVGIYTQKVTSAATEVKETLYISGYDMTIAVDPIKMEIIEEIPIKGPNRDMTWTKDGQTLFVNSAGRQEVAVVNTIKNEVVDTLTFSEPSNQITARIFGIAVDEKGETLYATLMRTKRKPAELVPLDPIIAVMDLETKEVVKEIDVPVGTHALQFLEDPTKLAVWAKDLYMLDLTTDELTKYHELMLPSNPNEQGIANYLYFWNRDKESANSLTAGMFKFFPDTEEVTENIFMVDRKTAEVTDIELPEPIGLFSVVVTNDKKYAYGGMNYIHKIKLDTMEIESIVHEPGTSYGYNLSSDGQTLYVSGAGADLSFIDTNSMEYKKILELPTDTMDIRVVQVQQ